MNHSSVRSFVRRSLRVAVLAFVASVAGLSAAWAQATGAISGTVTSTSTRNALQGALVTVAGANRADYTDGAGSFNLQGLPALGTLSRVIDAEPRQLTLPPRGIVISAKLADILHVRPGDEVIARVLEGRERELSVPIVGLAEDFAGMAAYMELHALNRLLLEGDLISGAHLVVHADRWPDFLSAVKHTPRAAGCVIKNSIRDGFRKTTGESIGLLQNMYLVFATIVAFGIIYNSARISLSERARELATLRVLGFSRGEVGAVLVGELVLLTVVALPLGLVIGSGFARGIIASVNTETVRLPLVLTASNYAFAVLVVALAAALSALFAARKLADINLVSALKALD